MKENGGVGWGEGEGRAKSQRTERNIIKQRVD